MLSFLKRFFRRTKGPGCSAVVAAAGASSRMEGRDKLMLPLDEKPVLAHTLLALQNCPEIDEIVVVTREELILPAGDICRLFGIEKATKIIKGGDTRLKSVLLGVAEVSSRARLIAVHDGARPLASPSLISTVIRKAAECGAAAPAVTINDTVKLAEDGVVLRTLERGQLRAVQTPQVFDAQLLRGALEQAVLHEPELTDDCAAVERLGMKVSLVPGEACNLKITEPQDLALAEALLDWAD